MRSLKINRNAGYVFITIVFICLIGVISYLLYNQHLFNQRSEQFIEALSSQKSEIDQARSLKRLDYEASSNMLYLPQLKIKIPYNSTSKSLLYSLRLDESGAETQEADITSDKFYPPPGLTQFDCTQFLRIKIEDKQNPYNPAEEAHTYKLQSGENLQVYVFSGELEGNHQCKDSYNAQGIYPKDLLNAFNGVKSY